MIESGLGLPARKWRIAIASGSDSAGLEEAEQATVSELKSTPAGMRFTVLDDQLPAPPMPAQAPSGAVWSDDQRLLVIRGLQSGKYRLSVDRQEVATESAEAWARGVSLRRGPEFAQVERLREAVIAKNRLYFFRWRPQNETYLFGFRKHEQGQNAREIPLFDPLVEEQESIIAALRKPIARYYELRRVEPKLPASAK